MSLLLFCYSSDNSGGLLLYLLEVKFPVLEWGSIFGELEIIQKDGGINITSSTRYR
jgi:hypothetical protein